VWQCPTIPDRPSPSDYASGLDVGDQLLPDAVSASTEQADIARTVPRPSSDLETILRTLEECGIRDPLLRPTCLRLITESKSTMFLFSHFVGQTARAMPANKDDASNPLLRCIVPLSLRSHIVMKTILMMSAIHVSETRPGWSALAWRYYGEVSATFEERMKQFRNLHSYSESEIDEQLVVCLMLAMFQVSHAAS
jgi:hypothetical protein